MLIEDAKGRTVESVTLIGTQKLGEDSSFTHQKKAKPLEIKGQDNIYSVMFLTDGKHILSSGKERKIQCWWVDNDQEVRTLMDAGSTAVCNIAVVVREVSGGVSQTTFPHRW